MMKMTVLKVQQLFPLIMLFGTLCAQQSGAEDVSWPRKITFEQGIMHVYQPQLEIFEGNSIEARAAISIRKGSEAAATYAAIRFTAITDSDTSAAVLSARKLELVELHIAEESLVTQEELARVAAQQLAGITLTITNDFPVTALNEDSPLVDTTGLRSDPPRIILSTEPAILVPIDGEPQLQNIEASDLQWVVNSTIPIIKQQQNFYLFGGGTRW